MIIRYKYRAAQERPGIVHRARHEADRRRTVNEFLFARVGALPNGMTLSILSMLAQQDVDPWDEVIRLGVLPPQEALEQFAKRLELAPIVVADGSTLSTLAAELIRLLPSDDDRLPLPRLSQSHDNETLSLQKAEILETKASFSNNRRPNWAQGVHFARLMIFCVASLTLIALAITTPGALIPPTGIAGLAQLATPTTAVSALQPRGRFK